MHTPCCAEEDYNLSKEIRWDVYCELVCVNGEAKDADDMWDSHV